MEKPIKHRFFTLSLLLRFVLSGLAFVMIFVVALNSILGYRLSLSDINFKPSSIIQINPSPPGSNVTINNQAMPLLSNNRLGVTDGNYLVKVSRDGYYDWQTVLPVRMSSVWWAEARLIPKLKQIRTVKTYDQVLASFASSNHKWMLNHLSLNLFELLDLSGNSVSFQTLDLKKLLSIETESVVDLRFFDWNLANNTAFFRDEIGGEMYVLNLTGSQQLVNLTILFGGLKFDQIKIATSDGKNAYVLSGDALYYLNFDRPTQINKIADNVAVYRVLNRNQVLFLAKPKTAEQAAQLRIYDLGLNRSVAIEEIDDLNTAQLEAFESKYDGRSYIALYDNHKFRVWQANLGNLSVPPDEADKLLFEDLETDMPVAVDNNAILDKSQITNDSENQSVLSKFQAVNLSFRTYFSSYVDDVPASLSVGGDGRFLILNLKDTYMTVDEYTDLYSKVTAIKDQALSIPPEPKVNADGLVLSPFRQIQVLDTNYNLNYDVQLAIGSGSFNVSEDRLAPNWLNNEIMWENVFGMLRIKDYNAQNQHKMTPFNPELDVQLSVNNRYLYFFQTVGDKQVLKRLNLVLE